MRVLDALRYTGAHGPRRALRKLVRAYVYGEHPMYLTVTDLIETAVQPEVATEYRVGRVQPDESLRGPFPHLSRSTIRAWAGAGHFFYLATLDGAPVGYRCLGAAPPPTLAPFFRLQPHQIYAIELFIRPEFRRRGLSRLLKIQAARDLVQQGYRETWGVEVATNYEAVVAADRTPIVRAGTLIRTCLLGRARFTVIPATVLSAGLLRRQLGLLRHLAPQVSRVGLLHNPSLVRCGPGAPAALDAAAREAGVGVSLVEIREVPDYAAALAAAFSSMAAAGVDGVIVQSDPRLRRESRSVVALAARHGLPAVFDAREFVAAGGVVAYGAPAPRLTDLAAVTAHLGAQERLLANPWRVPPRAELIVNREAAAALGVAIPDDAWARAVVA